MNRTRVSGWLAALELDGRVLGLCTALAAVWLGFDLASGGLFATPRNLYNLTVQASAVGVMATGMVLVIVARHIDLSVGSVLGFVAMVLAAAQVEWFPPSAAWNVPACIAGAIALGAAIGTWQGYWVAYRGVPAFVVTLAGLLVFRGAAWLVTDGRTVAPLDAGFQRLGGGLEGAIGTTWSTALGLLAFAIVVVAALRDRARRSSAALTARVALTGCAIALFVATMNAYTLPQSDVGRGVPIPVLILIGAGLLMHGLARATRFGRHVFAIGGSPQAAELAGIDVRRTTLAIFALMGALCGVAAVLTTARLGAGTNSLGTLAELNVIAAVVIGGTSLAGGAGTIAGALLGALLMQSLDNGMVLVGLSSAARQVAIGFALIGAVWVDSVYLRRRR